MDKVKAIEIVILSEEEKANDSVWKKVEKILLELEYQLKLSNQNNDTIIFHTYETNKEIAIEDIPTIVCEFEKEFIVESLRFEAEEDEWNQEKPSLLLRIKI